jgi:hypothetical protein
VGAETAGMTAGMTGDGIVGTTTAGTIVRNAGRNIKAIATDWTEGRETLARKGVPTPIIPAITATATVITVKDSAGVIFKASANMLAMGDGNLWTVLI